MSLATGIRCFRQGFTLVRRPRLRRFVWLPIVTSLVVVAALVGYVFSQTDAMVSWVIDRLPDAFAVVGPVLSALLYLVTLLAGGWLVGFVAVFLASPFLGNLSAGAEREAFGTGPEYETSLAREFVAAISRELRKLGYSLPRLLGVFLISLIPIVSPFAPLLWWIFGAWIMAVQFADYATENRGEPFRATLSRLRSNRTTAFGFGAVTTLLMAVPLLNVVVIPVAVCGGAMLWRSLDGSGGLSKEQAVSHVVARY